MTPNIVSTFIPTKSVLTHSLNNRGV